MPIQHRLQVVLESQLDGFSRRVLRVERSVQEDSVAQCVGVVLCCLWLRDFQSFHLFCCFWQRGVEGPHPDVREPTWSSSNTVLPVTLVRPFSVKSDEKIIKNHKMTLF
jgi:hypothetical protein